MDATLYIDLEGMHPISDLPQMPMLESQFDNDEYGELVTFCFRALYPNRANELCEQPVRIRKSFGKSLKRGIGQYAPIQSLKVWKSHINQFAAFRLSKGNTHLIEF